MCEFKSGIAVKLNEEEVRVYTLPLIDSHTLIREKHGIKENGLGMLSNMSTPVELIPRRFPLNFKKSSYWQFKFDADKPDWWIEGMTKQAVRQLMEAAKADFENDNEKEQLAVVKWNSNAIVYIKNPSEAVQMAAVKQNGYAIQHIKNPSEAVQMAAVKRDGFAIQSIKNPSEAVKKFVANRK